MIFEFIDVPEFIFNRKTSLKKAFGNRNFISRNVESRYFSRPKKNIKRHFSVPLLMFTIFFLNFSD